MDIVQVISQQHEDNRSKDEKLRDSITHLNSRIAWAAGRGNKDMVARLRVAKAARVEQLGSKEAA